MRPNHPLLRFLDDNFPRTYEWCSHGVRSHVVWLLLLLASTGVSGALASYRASLAGRGLRTGHFEWVNITGALSAREAMAWYDRLQGSIPVSTAEVGATGKLRSTVEGGAPLCLVIREREYAEDKWTQVGAEWMVFEAQLHAVDGPPLRLCPDRDVRVFGSLWEIHAPAASPMRSKLGPTPDDQRVRLECVPQDAHVLLLGCTGRDSCDPGGIGGCEKAPLVVVVGDGTPAVAIEETRWWLAALATWGGNLAFGLSFLSIGVFGGLWRLAGRRKLYLLTTDPVSAFTGALMVPTFCTSVVSVLAGLIAWIFDLPVSVSLLVTGAMMLWLVVSAGLGSWKMLGAFPKWLASHELAGTSSNLQAMGGTRLALEAAAPGRIEVLPEDRRRYRVTYDASDEEVKGLNLGPNELLVRDAHGRAVVVLDRLDVIAVDGPLPRTLKAGDALSLVGRFDREERILAQGYRGPAERLGVIVRRRTYFARLFLAPEGSLKRATRRAAWLGFVPTMMIAAVGVTAAGVVAVLW